MDKIFLKLIGAFDPVLEKTGVNTEQLHEILRIKLLMDGRRPNAMLTARKRAATSTKVQSPWVTTLVSVLMGLFISLVLFLSKMPYVGETYYFIIFMVLMSLTMISDFTTVLIDSRDQFILLPRPVNDRTLTMSRILHITIYVLRLALLQGLPAVVMIGFIDGPLAMPLFVVQILEATFISILFVNIIYLLMMKSVSPQRFKDIISYFQIGFSVVIFGAYYLLPRLIKMSVLANVDLLSHRWAYFLPPVWIAAFNELLIHPGRSNMTTGILAIVGFVLPLAGLWFVAKVLAPGFNRRLAVIATSDGSSNSVANTKKVQGFSVVGYISNLLAPDPVENAGFRITWKLAARTREFKMKVYPTFAYVPIYFVYFALNNKAGELADKLTVLQNGRSYVFLIYGCTFILAGMLTHISMSEKYKSSWVYYALPIDKPGKILSGMYKALVTLYFFPYCLVLSAGIIAIWGPQVINDLILAFLVSLIYGMLLALFMVKGLPFSKPILVKQSGGRFVTSLLIMGFIAAAGFGHYMLMKWETLIWLLILPALIANFVMFYYYKRQTWDNIELSEV